MPYPLYFITITFKDEITPEQAEKLLKQLIWRLNESALGGNYHKLVKHSYFGYIFTLENQTRGTLHIHGLIDSTIDTRLIYRFAHAIGGSADIERVRNPEAALMYILKDVDEPVLV